MTLKTIVLSAALLAISAGTLAAADKKIQAKDLPPAVQKAVQEETKGAQIKGYAKDVQEARVRNPPPT